MNSIIVCAEQITTNIDGYPICSSGWLTSVQSIPFDISQINPVLIAEFFGAGFFLTTPVMAACWGVSALINTIRGRAA